MKAFFDKFENLHGASFIQIKNYCNKYDEIANINLNTNVDTENAKKKDVQTLKSLTESDLEDIANSKNLSLDVLKTALSELIDSAEKNLSKDLNERTNQSKGQVDAYINLNKAIKMHKESTDIFVTGFVNHKEVIQKGEYPVRNKREKTKAKDAIKRHCDLRMEKFRTYKVGQIDSINITGSTLQIVQK